MRGHALSVEPVPPRWMNVYRGDTPRLCLWHFRTAVA